jgi:hypothetical protein
VSDNLVTFLSVTYHLFASAIYSTNAHGNKIVGRFANKLTLMHCDMFDASGIVVSVCDIFTEHAILSLRIGCRCRVGEIVVFYDSTNSTLVK